MFLDDFELTQNEVMRRRQVLSELRAVVGKTFPGF